jgi:hypothetical protein
MPGTEITTYAAELQGYLSAVGADPTKLTALA